MGRLVDSRALRHCSVVVILTLAWVGVWSTFDQQAGLLRAVMLTSSAIAYAAIRLGGHSAASFVGRGLAWLSPFVATLLIVERLIKGLVTPGFPQLGELDPSTSAPLDTIIPAGLIVIGLPFLIERRPPGNRARKRGVIAWSALLSVSLAGILVSASLASTAVVVAGAAVLGLRGLVGSSFRNENQARRVLFGAILLMALIVLAGLLILGDQTKWGIALSQAAQQRVELLTQAARLIEDYPIIGAGLGTIPGLYAHYIRGLPVYFVPHSQNLYVNAGIELGYVGLASLLGLYLLSLFDAFRGWRLLGSRTGRPGPAPGPIVTSLSVVLVLGLVDDPIYASWGLPLLFVFPALGLSFPTGDDGVTEKPRIVSLTPPLTITMGLVALAALAVLNWRVVASEWYSNLGAIEMAKVELGNWPSGEWSQGDQAPKLNLSEDLFWRAMSFHSGNRTALHRLGLVAMEKREYDDAVQHLEAAHRLDPGHRGIRKALGYSLTWEGEYSWAELVLAGIPEASMELSTYVHWWAAQDQPVLSDRSAEMAERLLEG